MPIIGINYENCTACRTCIKTCTRSLFDENERDEIIFEDPLNICNLCGHCIGKCPEDAILYEDIGESYSFEGINNPEIIVPYDNIYKFLAAHRSIRWFKKEKVPNDVLKKVFDVMQYAPTARNMRSESYTILSDDEKIAALSDAVQEEISKTPGLKEIYADRLVEAKKVFKSPIFFDAPHVIFISSRFDNEIEANNIGIIVTYGRLAAQALGISTCWNGLTQWAMTVNPTIKKMAGVRGKKFGVFIVGYPEMTFYRTAPRSEIPIKGF